MGIDSLVMFIEDCCEELGYGLVIKPLLITRFAEDTMSFAEIARQMTAGVKREFPSPDKARVTLPWGFPYEAYGANAVVKPWHVLNLTECGRALAMYQLPNLTGEPYLNVQDLSSDHKLFLGSIRLHISKHMYDLALPKSPLTMENKLVYVGRSSFNVQTDILLPSRSLTFSSCEIQCVMVNKQTARPTALPTWWKEKYGHYTSPERQLKVIVPQEPVPAQSGDSKNPGDLPIPDGITTFAMTIFDSDCDGYGHVNWSAYLKYCMDALVMGINPEEAKRMSSRALKSAEIIYIHEGLSGQQLTVKFWKDRSKAQAVHFHLVNCQSQQLVTYALLQFYSPQELNIQSKL